MMFKNAIPSILAAATLFSSSTALAGGDKKMDICHWDEDAQAFFVINVSHNAVDKHFQNHGDSAPADYWSDLDGDGFGDPEGTYDTCPQIGLVDNAGDCDDGDGAVNPGMTEIPYNGVDDDCNAATPDDDLDDDGFGVEDGDCDDSNSEVNPGMAETPYNGLDDDCDAATPDDDLDGDGFLVADDCDDLEASVNPGAEDLCGDGIDNNCDGAQDENCVGACPCFTVADIEQAYAWHAEADVTWDNPYNYCSENPEDWSYFGYQVTQIYFGGYNWDGSVYERDTERFFSYGLDEYYDRNYCAVNESTWEYDYDTGEYNTVNDYWYLQITLPEREACGAVVLEAAANIGMTCEVASFY